MMEIINYQGWPNCCRLSNGLIDLIVSTDFGPRVLRLGFIGQANEFYENKAWLGKIAPEGWVNYGGHRLWHAPEAFGRTYQPDNSPITVEAHGEFIRFIQPIEMATGIQKEMDIYLHPHKAEVKIVHRLQNHGLWAVQLAPWAVSVMAENGVAIIPLPHRGSHAANLLPNTVITTWAYTDMSDPRWTWGHRFIMLRQDPTATTDQKCGLPGVAGWAAYARANHLFVKQFTHQPDAIYPDFGSSMEFFTNPDILEVESLAPLNLLEPTMTVEHVEQWSLFDHVPTPTTEAEIEQHILPVVKQVIEL